MSRTAWDARRSLARYVAQFLTNQDWDVRLSYDEAVSQRPMALVEYGGPQILAGGPKVFDVTRPFVVYAYPTFDNDVEVSEKAADDTEELFVQALQIGGFDTGRARRIPLFDWDDIDKDEDVPTDAVPEGYLRLQDANTDTHRDPQDPKLWTVVVNIRATWRRLGEPKDELIGETVLSVDKKPVPS